MRLLHAIALARARWISAVEAGEMGFGEERRWAAGVSSVVTVERRKFGGAVGGARASIGRRTVLGPVDRGIGRGDGSGLDRRGALGADQPGGDVGSAEGCSGRRRRRGWRQRGGRGRGRPSRTVLGDGAGSGAERLDLSRDSSLPGSEKMVVDRGAEGVGARWLGGRPWEGPDGVDDGETHGGRRRGRIGHAEEA